MIYLDNAATTQIDPAVLDAMMPYLQKQYGNPGSVHGLGRAARQAVEKAREQVAAFLKAKPEQIIFTSGGTEANNMVFAMTRRYLQEQGRTHVVVSAVEHDSVLKAARNLADSHGFGLTVAPCDRAGKVYPTKRCELTQSFEDNTGLVSVMYVNNETGVTNDVKLAAKVVHGHGALFHTDCVHAASCRALNVQKLDCDFMTISAHKLHGPKGVGALYVKNPELFDPMIFGGGGQEFGLRGGTENVAAIVGFGEACDLMRKKEHNMDAAIEMESVVGVFLRTLDAALKEKGLSSVFSFNGSVSYGQRVVNIRLRDIEAETLILMLDAEGVCISAGSACNTMEQVPSHVLMAMGLTEDQARSSVRISLSRMNTAEEVVEAAKIIADCIETLKSIESDGTHD